MAILNAPLFHTGGLNVFTAPLVHIGGTSIVCRAFEPTQVFDLIRDAGVTLFFGVPTMFLALQQHPRWQMADFARLKLIISGGAPCPLAVFERFWEKGIDFKTGYGLTEAGPNTFWLPPADVRRKPGSVGLPLFHVDVKLIDKQGRECGSDEVGETLREGWLRTGDLARRDPEGYHYIVGRLKDVIISGGENIYPAEVESVLSAHPAVAEVAIIGVPDEKWGESPQALVVPKPGQPLNPDHLQAFGGERLARYKLPKRIVLVEALPKTAAGKIDKELLKKQYGGGASACEEIST